jgi:hypothetical protein
VLAGKRGGVSRQEVAERQEDDGGWWRNKRHRDNQPKNREINRRGGDSEQEAVVS